MWVTEHIVQQTKASPKHVYISKYVSEILLHKNGWTVKDFLPTVANTNHSTKINWNGKYQ